MSESPQPAPVERLPKQIHIEKWTPHDVPAIAHLEQTRWAPWLQRPTESIKSIAEKYPETQLVAKDGLDKVVGMLTATRVNWDGNRESLGTWDSAVGRSEDAMDYSATYAADGNTICLVSSAIDPFLKNEGVATRLVLQMKEVAKDLGAEHLIGPFRPSAYGKYQYEHGPISFEEYCKLERADGQPLDPWLRSAKRLGMQPLRVEEASMVVTVPVSKFEEYQNTYQTHEWKQMEDGRWLCGETGTWRVDESSGTATYTEPNLWGEIPLNNNTPQTSQ